jgi:gliding motility-associated-like protein
MMVECYTCFLRFLEFFVKKAFIMPILLLLLSGASLSGQEICDNGIDDDGDNLVDVYDPDCPCDDQTLLCTPSCEFVSPGGPLNFGTKWTSADTIPVYQSPLVADIDNDGVTEVIMMSSHNLSTVEPRRARDILIINGTTGVTELAITTPFMAWVGPTPIAVADIDHDGFGEIIMASVDHTDNAVGDRSYLYCYEHTGALKWKSNVPYGYTTSSRFGSSIGIADFNSDGVAEVYIYNQIYNAETGVKLAEGGSAEGQGVMARQPYGDVANPVAADLTSDPGLELAAGKTVYNVTITNLTGTSGNAMIPITIPGRNDGYTAIADIDLDGTLDVVVASAGTTGQLYVWNPGNGTPYIIASIDLANTGGNWIGVPFIGDMDKDCEPEIGVTRSRRVYALDYNGSATLATKWTLVTTDASGFTGITMFDFNQDGTQELVYRDESTLRIIDGSGSTPVTVGTNPCISGTGTEMPVVADVDGDGQAEICVSCATLGTNIGSLQVFESSGQPWAPCRDIWNQYSYLNVNINNNLTIPIQQQQHQVLLSTIACPFYNCSENRPFNTFLSQATFLTQEGCPIYPASDVALSLESSSCNGSGAYNISLTVTNIGGAPSVAGFPIQFYAGNPFTSNATLIPITNGNNITQMALNPDETETLSFVLDILAPQKPFSLFAVLNDDGTNITPFAFPLSSIPECSYGDNVISIANINCCPFGDLSIDTVSPLSATFCEGESERFSVQASSTVGLTNAIYTWTLPDNSTVLNDSIIVADGGTYTITVKDDAQCSVSQQVIVTSVALPTNASAGPNQEVCETSTALEGNVPTIGTGTWTLISGSGTIQNANSPTSNVTGLAIGENVFRWAILNGASCLSDDTVTVNRLPFPTTSIAGDDQQICDTLASLSANVPTVGTGLWSLVSGSGTLTDATAASTTVTNLGAGINVFRWTISNGICTPSADDVTIERFAPPSIADAGDDQQICATSTQLSATVPSIGTGLWTLVSGNATISSNTSASSGISGLSPGSVTLRWTVSNGTCPVSEDEVTIQIDEAPSPASVGADVQVCSADGNLLAIAPTIGTGLWTISAGGATITDATSLTSEVTNLSTGLNTFIWTVSNGTCPPSTATFGIQRDAPPSIADAGLDQQICATSATLSATAPTVGTGIWSLVSGSGTFSNNASASSAVSDLSLGENVFEWTVSSGVCPVSTAQVTIQSDEVPSNVNAGENQSICSDQTTLGASVPSTGNGIWTLISGSASIDDASDNESALTNVALGSSTLRWTVTSGACSTFAEVTITRSELPSQALAGDDQSLCGTSGSLNGNTPAIGSGTWTVLSGSATIDDPSNPQASISDIAVGTNELVWTISSGSCPAEMDTVAILVSEDPITPNAGQNQAICVDNAQLNATAPLSGTGTWSLVSGVATIDDASNSQSTLSDVGIGISVLRWTIIDGACEAFAQVSITRSENPSTANAGENQEVCQGTAVNLAANVPLIGTGAWSVSSGSATFDNTAAADAIASDLSNGTVVLTWTISNGACLPSADDVEITVNENNALADAGASQSICGDTITLNAAVSPSGTGAWTLQSGSGDIANANQASTLVSNLGLGANTFVWTVTNGSCEPLTDEVTITVDAIPTEALAGDDQQICSDTTTLNASAALTGSGLWTVITGNGVFADATNANSSVSGISSGVNVYQWTISNGVCPPSSDQVIVQRDSVSVIAFAGDDASTCNSAPINLTAGEPLPGSGLWSIVSGDGIIAESNNPNSEFTPTGFGTSVLRWTVTTGDCPETSDEVSITNLEPPSLANAGADTAVCSTLLILNAEIPTIGNGVWSSLGSVVFNDIAAADAEASMLLPGNNTLIWTVSNGVCPANSDTLIIAVTKTPITPNAGADQSICADVATLSAAVPAVGTGVWSLVSGNAIIDDESSVNSAVSGLDVGVTTFRWTVTNESCVVFDEVSITRSEPPSVSDAGEDIFICGIDAQLNAAIPSIGTGLWSLVSGGGTITDVNAANSTVTGIPSGNSVYQWTVSSGSCKPSVSTVQITRDTSNAVANAGEPIQVCADTATLNATPALGAQWSVTSGTAVIDDVNAANSSVSGLSVGQTTLTWTVPANGSCPETSATVTITRSSPPSAAIAGEDEFICGTTYTLMATAAASGTGVWEVIAGNAIVDEPGNPNSTVSNLGTGNNVFEWQITNGSCPVETDEVTIAVGDTAFAGQDQFVCDTTAQLSGNLPSGLTGVWTVISGDAILADSSQASTSVSNLSDGENIFQWTIIGGFCPDSTDQVTITQQCNTPPVISNEEFELVEDSVLIANLLDENDFDPDSTTLIVDTNLVVEPNHGTFVVNEDGSFTYTPEANYYGSDTIVVSVCDSGLPLPALCGNDTIIIVISPVNDPPTVENEEVSGAPGATVSGNVLDNDSDIENTTLTVNTDPLVGPTNGTFTINPDGTFTYEPDEGFIGMDTIVVAVCDSGFPLPQECVNDTIFITIQGETLTVNAGEDQELCETSGILNAGSIIAPAVGLWTQVGGSATIENPDAAVSSVSGLALGENIFVWTVTDNGQTASDTVVITVNQAPTPAFAGEDIDVCGNEATLQGNIASLGTGVWSLVAGTGIISDPNATTIFVNGLSEGVNQFQYTITLGNCISSDLVSITSYSIPSLSVMNDSSVCSNVSAITIDVQSSGQGVWSITSGTGVFSSSNPNEVSGLSLGANEFTYTVSNGPCSSSESVVITYLSANLSPCIPNDIFIPEGFSPDNDGVNDKFVLYGLNGRSVVIKVFNRWGNLVYESDNYQNDWDGVCTTGWILTGERLPEGTYYYLVQIEGESDTRKGYLTLWR